MGTYECKSKDCARCGVEVKLKQHYGVEDLIKETMEVLPEVVQASFAAVCRFNMQIGPSWQPPCSRAATDSIAAPNRGDQYRLAPRNMLPKWLRWAACSVVGIVMGASTVFHGLGVKCEALNGGVTGLMSRFRWSLLIGVGAALGLMSRLWLQRRLPEGVTSVLMKLPCLLSGLMVCSLAVGILATTIGEE